MWFFVREDFVSALFAEIEIRDCKVTEVAAETGVSRDVIYRLRSRGEGAYRLNVGVLTALCSWMNVDPGEFFVSTEMEES